MRLTRREFLYVAAAASGVEFCGLGCQVPSPVGTASSCTQPSIGTDPLYCLVEAEVVRVQGAASLAEGRAVLVNADDNTAVIVARDANGFHALSGVCTHACCIVSLCGNVDCSALTTTPGVCEATDIAAGDAAGASILCPCHGSTFRLSDGTPLSGPATTPLPSYALSFDGYDALVDTGTEVDAATRV